MTHDIPHKQSVSSDTLIRRLQSRLLSLGDDEESVSAAEIERTAKAITQLITSIERAENFLSNRTQTRQPGFRLEGEARQRFLRRVKCFVERGGLKELEVIDLEKVKNHD